MYTPINNLIHNFNGSKHPILDVLGATIQFVVSPDEANGELCLFKGTMPPDAFVPLHSHTDIEAFYLVSGRQEVLLDQDGVLKWTLAKPGDFIRIPGGHRHAFRNLSAEPAVSICTTSATLGRFFEEIGRPVSMNAAATSSEPRTADLMRFLDAAQRYGYWLASPEENMAAGVPLGDQISR